MGFLDGLMGRTAHTDRTVDESLALAVRLIVDGNDLEDHGQFEAALALYNDAIKSAPTFPRAQLNRGNALLALGRIAEAIAAYDAAIALDPHYPPAHFNRGNALAQAGLRDEARTAYSKAIELRPEFLDAEIALGALEEDLGQLSAAAEHYRRALALNSEHADVHANLAALLDRLSQPEEAIASYRRALELNPGLLRAHHGLGLALQQLSRFEDAVDAYCRGLNHAPRDTFLLNNLGNALLALGQTDEAIGYLRRAADTAPQMVDVQYNLGKALVTAGRVEAGIGCLRDALAIDQDHCASLYMLGNALKDSSAFEEALACYRRVTELQPDNAETHYAIGNTLGNLARMDEAAASFRSAIAARPDFFSAHSNLLFIANYLERSDQAPLLAEARQFGRRVALKARPFANWTLDRDPARTLRIGFVSPDLRNHPVGYFLVAMLEALVSKDGARIEAYAYSNHSTFDALSARIRSACTEWRSVAGKSDEEVALQIRDDHIDILIDLAGHTASNRLPLFAWKAAPIQASWLGYFATTGVDAIDYLIADDWSLPEPQEQFFTERIWRLPRTRLCFSVPDAETPVSMLPALANGFVTFGCCNDVSKLNDAVIEAWSSVLGAVPNSRLLVKARQLNSEPVKRDLLVRFTAAGVPLDRLTIEGPSNRADYLKTYDRIDIALDPFPYPGGTTTVESLWMGVPVLTLSGESFLSRQGVGLLANAGLPDWIARDRDDYVRRAAAFASDLPKLATLRSELRDQVLRSPIFDAPAFAEEFAAALRAMWQRWCSAP